MGGSLRSGWRHCAPCTAGSGRTRWCNEEVHLPWTEAGKEDCCSSIELNFSWTFLNTWLFGALLIDNSSSASWWVQSEFRVYHRVVRVFYTNWVFSKEMLSISRSCYVAHINTALKWRMDNSRSILCRQGQLQSSKVWTESDSRLKETQMRHSSFCFIHWACTKWGMTFSVSPSVCTYSSQTEGVPGVFAVHEFFPQHGVKVLL